MGSHYPGTLRQKEAHEQSTLGCPAASFCASFCSAQDLIWALNLQIWAVLHLPSLLVCCIHRHTKMRIIIFCAAKKIISNEKNSENMAEICILAEIFTIFSDTFFFFFYFGEIFCSRHFCSNLDSLTLYSTSIPRVSKMLISSHTRNCKVLLGMEVIGKHFHN